MCGIAGFTFPKAPHVRRELGREASRLRQMVASLHHRGPDAQEGLLLDGVALGHTRLAIVDVDGGGQPMVDPTTGLAVVFNGEIFNHVELRDRLSSEYRFRTRSDTEVILAAFLRYGIACVRHFIGQFAFALFDPRSDELWLARDRVGIRPLFYAFTEDADGGAGGADLVFASEAKALFAAGFVEPALDPKALKETLTLWAPVAPRTAFRGVLALPPGCFARYAGGRLAVERYWTLDLSTANVRQDLRLPEALEELDALIGDAVRLRLRADVPVAAYLSGGLDSSLVCALAQRALGGTLQTFSVGFAHARYDEREYQEQVAAELSTSHHAVTVDDALIGELLPTVVTHAEQVLLRSAPAPFFALSRLVRQHGTKVVLTGEGADEIFWGYDLYKETRVRQFWARDPRSTRRPRLFARLYPYLDLSNQPAAVLRQFYGIGLEEPQSAAFSHLLRWTSAGRICRFFSHSFADGVADHDPIGALLAAMPRPLHDLKPLARAQALEMESLLSGYLLSAQGDRMLMSNSVEGRFPFLDHRLIEWAARLPDGLKLRGLDEKHLLKRFAAGKIPPRVTARTKFPYRAPIAEALCGARAPEWAEELLSRRCVESVGIYDSAKVARLVAKLTTQPHGPSEADAMALMAIASTQLLARAFQGGARLPHEHLTAVRISA